MQTNNSGQPSSMSKVIKTLVLEIGIIILLTSVVIAALNYFKIIDVKALFSGQSSISRLSKNNLNPVPSQINSNKGASRNQSSPAIKSLTVLARNKALHYAQTINEFEGKIKSIDISGGVEKNTKLKYQVRLELGIGTGSATFVSLYPKEAMDKIKIVDSKKKTLTINDLKPGDSVTIKTNLITLRQYPNNFNEVLITVK